MSIRWPVIVVGALTLLALSVGAPASVAQPASGMAPTGPGDHALFECSNRLSIKHMPGTRR